MTLQVSQTISGPGGQTTLTTPTALTPAATDTIDQSSFGPTGLIMFVVTTGTQTDVTVLDPSTTPTGYAGTVPTLTGTATGHRAIFVPRTAISPSTGVATVTFSGARTGVTYYLMRV
jgi:hypothetical protein